MHDESFRQRNYPSIAGGYMTLSYRIALFVHFCALIAAVVASALVHFGSLRQAQARFASDAGQWRRTVMKVELVFPIAILTFFASGGYMVQASGMWRWSAGWIIDGIIGAAALFVLGGYNGRRGKGFAARLDEHARRSPDAAPLAPDGVSETIGWMSSGLALAVVCVMTFKPGVLPGLAMLCSGLMVGALVSALVARRAYPFAGLVTNSYPDSSSSRSALSDMRSTRARTEV